MKRLFMLAAVICLAVVTVKAQNDIDAFRFSQSNWLGTARFMGAGGAFGAVGAEYSALNINPASIGVYKKSEITFTPVVVSIFDTKLSYNGTTSRYSKGNYSLNNFGAVFKTRKKESSKWDGAQFALGYNRIHDFNGAFRIEGRSQGSTIMDAFAESAKGVQINNLTGEVGFLYDMYLLDPDPDRENHYCSVLSGSNFEQHSKTTTSGAIDEMNFSMGGNYDDCLYVGATIGVPILKYTKDVDYKEVDVDDEIIGFDSYHRYENLSVKGAGINLKLGVIYQPVNFFRMGVAFHTPTYYGKLKDNYKIHSTFVDDKAMTAQYPNSGIVVNDYQYKLITPMRLVGSVAFLIQKRAFISADYEFANYGSAFMYADDYSFSKENDNIQDKYGACHSIRIGSEILLTDNFLVRAGYNYTSNAFKSTVENNSAAHLGSIGIGFRSKSFFIDFAYSIRFSKENYWMYNPLLVSVAKSDAIAHRVAATVGLKF